MKIPGLALALVAVSNAAALAQAPTTTDTLGFYRSPDIRGETVVFAAGT